ncbi:MAG TPA: penicillin-insensitive murein endopeptidase [Candidatus Binatia bacterium]|jgi:penicillin-insensitive murein endopeptidase
MRLFPLKNSWRIVAIVCALHAEPARAQETAAEEVELRAEVLRVLPVDSARRAFGEVTAPTSGEAEISGQYWDGCLRGAVELPASGEHWQVMRPSRNRAWGHPAMIRFLEKFADQAAKATGWRGILIGDVSQPRGGPMLTGHASHQIGLDADIYLLPMPNRAMTNEEIENLKSPSLLRADRRDVDPKVYAPAHLALLREAARQPEVERVFVNAGIKRALCRDAESDREWLAKIRPVIGHDYHFHIRLYCPPGQAGCKEQEPPASGDGCGKELDYWFSPGILAAKPSRTGTSISLRSMPAPCQQLARESTPASIASVSHDASVATAAGASAHRHTKATSRSAPAKSKKAKS